MGLTTFDNEDELEKISALHPNCELVLRIRHPADQDNTYLFGEHVKEKASSARTSSDSEEEVKLNFDVKTHTVAMTGFI